MDVYGRRKISPKGSFEPKVTYFFAIVVLKKLRYIYPKRIPRKKPLKVTLDNAK